MKPCKSCKITKPLTEFFKDKALKDKHASKCKLCKTKSTYEWREKNKDHYNAKMRAYHKENYHTERLYRYNLSREAYNSMLEHQKGLCKLCGKANESTKRSFAIDHCHTSGKVRGILCYGCNRLMVLLDDEILLAKAIAYKKAA